MYLGVSWPVTIGNQLLSLIEAMDYEVGVAVSAVNLYQQPDGDLPGWDPQDEERDEGREHGVVL